jgi:hypothetical protein
LSGCPSLASVDSISATLARKSTTAPLRRRPTFNDAFTFLLAPVLATAFIVDTSWKAKQRKDWDDKISAVKEEINQLQEREQRVWKSLQLRLRPVRFGHQSRGYATSAAVQPDLDEREWQIEMPLLGDDSMQDGDVVQAPRHISQDVASESPRVYKDGTFTAEEMANFHRYHRLNAIMLSVRMLLHLQIGPSPFFAMFSGDGLPHEDALEFPHDSGRLVHLLKVSRQEMRPLGNYRDLFLVSHHINAQALKSDLHNAIRILTTNFDEGRISLGELVNGFGSTLLQTTEVPSAAAYTMLIRSFSKVGSHSLSYYAAGALKKSTLPLSDTSIFHMLFSVGQACDSRSLNHILPVITRSDSEFNVMSKWERVHVRGLDLPVPASLNPKLLQVLVYTALRCEQPERAEAWLTLLREVDYGSMYKDHLFRSFLTYYALHGNWEKGQVWLRRCVQHASSIAATSMYDLARVIFRMLDLCVRCRKLPEYTLIIDAAVKAGIGPPPVAKNPNHHRVLFPRARSILLEWEALPVSEDAQAFSPEERVRCFQEACRPLTEHIAETDETKSQQSPAEDGEDEFVLMPPTTNSLRYAIRRQLRSDGTSDSEPAADKRVGGEMPLGEVSKMQARFQLQDSTITSLKARLAIAEERYKLAQQAQRESLANVERLQRDTVKLRHELDESRLAMQRLQDQSRSHGTDHATLRQELTDLRALARQLMQHQQAAKVAKDVAVDEDSSRTETTLPPQALQQTNGETRPTPPDSSETDVPAPSKSARSFGKMAPRRSSRMKKPADENPVEHVSEERSGPRLSYSSPPRPISASPPKPQGFHGSIGTTRRVVSRPAPSRIIRKVARD